MSDAQILTPRCPPTLATGTTLATPATAGAEDVRAAAATLPAAIIAASIALDRYDRGLQAQRKRRARR